ncbi:SMI1/KNR4 family protein [Gemmata massiliana]|uniref:SMI1/KNR4 family protein n=1 Tax=Gemmata massiliana TaxID=1210884 RepID=UPI0013A6F332|nr:SMI1/KNR4 family protein [Gemmata massiliana]
MNQQFVRGEREVDYPSLLETVLGHLEELGVTYLATSGELVTDEVLESAEASMKIRLPAELREFYQTVGDGFSFFWESDSGDPKTPWGSLPVPSLSSLVKMYTGWRGLVLYSPERAEEYGFPHTKDPALAKHTAARMWHWLPIIAEENGDAICLDLGAPGCPVVFDQHDWMDGGSGDNGHPLGANWREFLIGWGSVCFQMPKDLYWPWCFRPGGVAWDGEHFHSRFRVAELAKLHNA